MIAIQIRLSWGAVILLAGLLLIRHIQHASIVTTPRPSDTLSNLFDRQLADWYTANGDRV